NSINKKIYIGSAVDLSNRLSSYYSTTYMEDALKRGLSHIFRALLKNGHSTFSLTILEYCEPSKCLIREKHYWDLLNPEYNIAKNPTAPMSGRKHSEETRKKMSSAEHSRHFKPGKDHPMFGKNLSDEVKMQFFDKDTNETTRYDSISAAARALNIKQAHISMYFANNQQKPYKGRYTFNKRKGKPRTEGSGRPSQQIEVFDKENNQTTIYDSIREAARALNIPSYKSISKYFTNNQQKPYKDRYTFKKVN
ncbi:GIY-YIG endonuclease, partial [Tuber brumale]